MTWLDQTTGWLLLYEEAYLQSLASTLGLRPIVVNIGAGGGTSVCALLRGLQDTQSFVYSLDIDPQAFDRETKALKAQGFDTDRVEQLEINSGKAAKTWKQQADLVFIDGEHSYKGVARDLRLWSKIVKPGGLLVCHDYGDPRQIETSKAISDWQMKHKDWLVIGRVIYMIAFRKPGGNEEWRNGRL